MFYDEYTGRFAIPAEPDTKARFRAEYYENLRKDAEEAQPAEPTYIDLSQGDLNARENALTSPGRFVRG